MEEYLHETTRAGQMGLIEDVVLDNFKKCGITTFILCFDLLYEWFVNVVVCDYHCG